LAELYVNDPQSLIIQGLNTVLANDSLCILQFYGKSKNTFGSYVSHKMEYYIVRHEKPKPDGKYGYDECIHEVGGFPDQLLIKGLEYYLNIRESNDSCTRTVDDCAYTIAFSAYMFSDFYREVK